ncbi:unnamed protein product [Musa textilis]
MVKVAFHVGFALKTRTTTVMVPLMSFKEKYFFFLNCNFKYKCTSSLVPLFLKGPFPPCFQLLTHKSCYWKLQSESLMCW